MASIGTTARSGNSWATRPNDVVDDPVLAMSMRFPVTCRLVGEDSFDAAVRGFVAAKPHGSHHGIAFPQFLRRLGRDACFSYVADIAELEAARDRACYAAEASPLSAAVFAAIPRERLSDLRLSFHPSVGLIQSIFPIVSVWQANQNTEQMALREWRTEAALVARPVLDVEVWRLPPGGFRFFTELSRGSTIARSAESAEQAPGCDLEVNLSLLRAANIVIACW